MLKVQPKKDERKKKKKIHISELTLKQVFLIWDAWSLSKAKDELQGGISMNHTKKISQNEVYAHVNFAREVMHSSY